MVPCYVSQNSCVLPRSQETSCTCAESYIHSATYRYFGHNSDDSKLNMYLLYEALLFALFALTLPQYPNISTHNTECNRSSRPTHLYRIPHPSGHGALVLALSSETSYSGAGSVFCYDGSASGANRGALLRLTDTVGTTVFRRLFKVQRDLQTLPSVKLLMAPTFPPSGE